MTRGCYPFTVGRLVSVAQERSPYGNLELSRYLMISLIVKTHINTV
jgi:hypothetical protein